MNARILIAEADSGLARLYRNRLMDADCVARTAGTGLSCVAILRRFRPNLLVLGTDLLWGGAEGVLAVLDEEPDLRPEIVTVLARSRERGILRRLASYRIDGYQWKPVSPTRLVNLLNAMLAQGVASSVAVGHESGARDRRSGISQPH
jgi:DNA-binding response OmpR family regulator